MERAPYPSDLTDAEWAILSESIPKPLPGARPVAYARREIVCAANRLWLGLCAARIPPVEYGLFLLSTMAADGDLGAGECRADAAITPASRTGRQPVISHHR